MWLESHNAPVNILIGARGIGKSYHVYTKFLYEFMKYGKPFASFVEVDKQIREVAADDCVEVFETLVEAYSDSNLKKEIELLEFLTNAEIKAKGNKIFINDTPVIHYYRYAEFGRLKGKNRKITNVMFDEFIPANPTFIHRKLIDAVADIPETFSRIEDLKMYMLANPIVLQSDILNALGARNIKLNQKVYDYPFLIYRSSIPSPSQATESVSYLVAKKLNRAHAIEGVELIQNDKIVEEDTGGILVMNLRLYKKCYSILTSTAGGYYCKCVDVCDGTILAATIKDIDSTTKFNPDIRRTIKRMIPIMSFDDNSTYDSFIKFVGN